MAKVNDTGMETESGRRANSQIVREAFKFEYPFNLFKVHELVFVPVELVSIFTRGMVTTIRD